MKLGALVWPTRTSWPALRDVAWRVESAGFDSLWTWDHLMGIVGGSGEGMFEGWSVAAAWAATTERIRIGLLVGSNPVRHPMLTAKLASTLDHLSEGRAVLGLGAGGSYEDLSALGLDHLRGEPRFRQLAEAVPIIRRLLGGEVVDHRGEFYRLAGARCAPLPVQPHLPLAIGGTGPRHTLRLVAEHADMWNAAGPMDHVLQSKEILAAHAAAAGRDLGSIQLSVNRMIYLRDGPSEARAALERVVSHHGWDVSSDFFVRAQYGPPELIAEEVEPLVRAGFGHFVLNLVPPFDEETIERAGELRALLGA